MTTGTVPSHEACPACGSATGVRPINGTSPKVRAWSCTACGLDWAISVVNPHLRTHHLAEAAEEIRRLSWTLRQVVALADDAPTITDQQLRDRLLALAEHAR
ncbi:MAG: hypothetical protein ACRDRX_07140 [Pseudonocardiaceae bacterium]